MSQTPGAWNPNQYLKFADERTRPCRDLAAAISLPRVERIIDLGCGPGNSTTVLAERWPDADITGLDHSTSMIEVACREQPQRRWIVRDISDWAEGESERFDLVFSNAALQWVDDHETLYPKLMKRLRPGGALAVQIPSGFNELPHRLMRELAPAKIKPKVWHAHEPGFYYDALAPHAVRVDVWETIYQHVLPDADAIVEWYKGTGLRPYLEAIVEDTQREQFLTAYRARIREAYTPSPDGKVLFPFRRLFVVACRGGLL
jgi:trans-aconitate 2-methyltransferase